MLSKKINSRMLNLRPITDSDTPFIVRWRNTESVRKNFLYREPFTAEIHEKWLKEKVYTGKVIQYIIEYKGHPVGSVYLRDIDKENSSAELGIFIGENSVRGKGIGADAVRLMLDFAHNQLGLHRIFLRLIAENISAYKAYRKAGFVTEGIFRDMKKLDGKYTDIMFMSSIQSNSMEKEIGWGGGYKQFDFANLCERFAA